MITKIIKITSCGECPNCSFDTESGDIIYWGKHYCHVLLKIVDPDKEIPQECPLENAGL